MDNIFGFLQQIITIQDPGGGKHANHVENYAIALAQAIDLPQEQVNLVGHSARLHDIGKIGISDYVIHKPGRLSEAEYVMIQHHPLLGHKLLEPLALDPMISGAILHHHENYDGTGYPQRIAGEQIPLAARIIRIADTYDALLSDRGYRPAFPHRKALRVIEADADKFDPVLLELFLKLVSNKKLQH